MILIYNIFQKNWNIKIIFIKMKLSKSIKKIAKRSH